MILADLDNDRVGASRLMSSASSTLRGVGLSATGSGSDSSTLPTSEFAVWSGGIGGRGGVSPLLISPFRRCYSGRLDINILTKSSKGIHIYVIVVVTDNDVRSLRSIRGG